MLFEKKHGILRVKQLCQVFDKMLKKLYKSIAFWEHLLPIKRQGYTFDFYEKL